MKHPIIIIGAGVSGLWAASLLTQQGIACRLLEARNRIGGRVLSISDANRPDLGRFDLGPTWFWPQYEQKISSLVKELNVATFDQYTEGALLAEHSLNEAPKRYTLPENGNAMSVRIRGGVQTLIEAISDTIPPEIIELGTTVSAIRQYSASELSIQTLLADGTSKEFMTSAIILALPPRMVARHIEFSPPLPPNLLADLASKPTWMASHAKVVAVYERPFWREVGLSGNATSWVGPLQEIHDASPETGSGALFGFFGWPAIQRQELGQEELLKLVTGQLVRFFGPEAHKMKAMLYKDWSTDTKTAVKEDLDRLHDFPQYGYPPDTGIWGKNLIFAGTETDPQFGGHLEGALQAAEKAVAKLMNLTDQLK
ncbi:flavin monoamine oxidase family protein [Sporosarcina cyprini]|uniref:flavin monoamine oxidase family protein n=1 Tax=Sporosarcina cyprini TaxID=2910523 RepID=UPI001EDDDAC7|nr:FAD-dependent oxidoreductase [Sporosarcina cyprini]MCG3087696.1 FAD-dependent oxidoreductase [Sporosarcina cyprini]